jgi:hypothetical protein
MVRRAGMVMKESDRGFYGRTPVAGPEGADNARVWGTCALLQRNRETASTAVNA